jgi:Tol biopolymer transport system component
LFGGFVNKQAGYEIFAFDPAGTGTLYPLMARGYEPAASPDGTKIAFASPGKPAGIYIMNSNGSSLQLIIPGGRQPSWGL